MTDLYEITRTLVRRGCPEHPRLRHTWYASTLMPNPPEGGFWSLVGRQEPRSHRSGITDDDARAIWTQHALEWALGLIRASKLCVARTPYVLNFIDAPGAERAAGKDILEAIEAATRHLEPQERLFKMSTKRLREMGNQ